MIELHEIVRAAVAPVKVRGAETYADECTAVTNAPVIEISDTDRIIAAPGEGTGIIENGSGATITIYHLGNALKRGARKTNNLPTACDIIAINGQSSEIVLGELTESKERSIEGVAGSRQPGKREKAARQLRATIDILGRTIPEIPGRPRKAIFFFRLPTIKGGVAARAMRAFTMNPTFTRVTVSTDPDYPGWEFRSHPYPKGYRI